jgi:enamine deaminase RidA (YjgF/YER057c/UK114 family)
MAEGSDAPRVRAVQPPHFARPRGYANGMVASGRTLWVAGQVGWEHEGHFVATTLPAQFARALDHVLDVVREAGGAPSDIVNMTVYVTDLEAYRRGAREIGEAWRQRLGRHFPAMALVGVAGLVEDGALVEIQAQAVLP